MFYWGLRSIHEQISDLFSWAAKHQLRTSSIFFFVNKSMWSQKNSVSSGRKDMPKAIENAASYDLCADCLTERPNQSISILHMDTQLCILSITTPHYNVCLIHFYHFAINYKGKTILSYITIFNTSIGFCHEYIYVLEAKPMMKASKDVFTLSLP